MLSTKQRTAARHQVLGSLALVACAGSALILPATSGANVSFVGQTSQNRTVRVTVGEDGLVRRFSIGGGQTAVGRTPAT